MTKELENKRDELAHKRFGKDSDNERVYAFEDGFNAYHELMQVEREKVDELVKVLEFLVKHEAKDGEEYACTFCDMGGSGYSSRGGNHHDDIKHVCPVFKAREALAKFREGDVNLDSICSHPKPTTERQDG